jgi:tetratricopeptide (TPR) repeat protein
MLAIKSINLGEDNQKVYDNLIVAVEASDGVLSLLLAVCDEPQLQDQIIQRYSAELQPKIRPYQVLLYRKEPSLREAIAEVVKKDSYLQSGGRAVITVIGADQLVSRRLGEERSEKEIFFGYLQWTRESLREYPYPIILWLTNPLLTELSRRAPDFWSWRKDVFRFKSLSIPNNLPYGGNPRFIGREAELAQLHEQLQGNDPISIFAIAGLGGVGKTELALQYAYQHLSLQTYPGGICWVGARQDVGTQILGFARSTLGLPIPDNLDLSEQVAYCWRHWPPGEVLLIFDDVLNDTTIQPFLPPADPRFKVLLTTRLRLARPLNQLSLDVLPEIAALEFLRSIVGKERIDGQLEHAQALCAFLGYLPLALELVARYLVREPSLSIADLLDRLQTQPLAAQALARPEVGMTAGLGVASTFELSWQELTEAQQSLAYLLSLFALAPIPWSAVTPCFAPEHEEDLEDWRDLGLVHRSLLQRIDQDTYQLHQLIREFFRAKVEQWPQADQLKQHFCQQMARIAQQFPQTPTQDQVTDFTPLVSHVAEAATTLQPWLSQEDLIWPFVGLGRFYQGQGAYAQAEPWYQGCLSAARSRLGDSPAETRRERHPAVASSLNNLALLYCAQGRYEAAEPLYHQALELWREVLGDRHPAVAQSLNNLAGLYDAQGRYSEAEPLYQQALDLRRELLGDRHPDVATSLNNLAAVYESQGRYEAAEPLYQQALELSRELLGDRHPQVATSLNNLAAVYESQGRYEAAEPLYRQALDLRRELLGDRHPDVATSLNNLAAVYESQGRYEAAEPLYRQALELSRELLGERHPQVATSLNNLAALYASQERYDEAEPLYQQALELRQELLGDRHPDVATSLNNLAGLYYAQGRYEAAEPLYQQALELSRELLGERHPQVATSLNNLAALYASQGRYDEAEPLYRQALELRQELLGDRHPDVATSFKNLANLYHSQGHYGLAEPLYCQALDLYRELLGDRHPDVATSLNNLAELYRVQGRYKAAEPLYLEALAILAEAVGTDHPNAQTVLGNLVAFLQGVVGAHQTDQLSDSSPG